VRVIEPRLVIAFGLIVLLIAGVGLAIYNLTYNSPKQKRARARRKAREEYRRRFPESDRH
jgi:F0F1-type ATP synthase assembly protein I